MNFFSSQSKVSITNNRTFAQRMELLFELVKRDLKAKYKNTFLGILWIFIQPLLLTVLFIFVKSIFAAKFFSHTVDYFSMFAVIIAWQFFSTSLQRGSTSIDANKHLVCRIKFPIILLPVSAVISALVDTLINILILFFLMLFLKKVLFVSVFYLVFVLAISSIFIGAVTILFAVLICFIADIRHLVPFITKASLFTLPILFDDSMVPTRLKAIYQNIPLVWMISEIKKIVSHSATISLDQVLNITLVSIFTFLLVYLLFKLSDRFIVDYI